MVPEGWSKTCLADVADHQKGFAFSSTTYRTQGIRVIRISDTTRDSLQDKQPAYVEASSAKTLSRYKLDSGDIVLSTVGSRPHLKDSMVGKAIRIPASAAGSLLNQNLVKLTALKDVASNNFLYLLLKSEKFTDYISSLVRGNANQVSITLSDIFAYQFISPPIEEQRKIAKILQTWDRAIATTEKLIDASKQQKKALMQQLLTGKKRFAGFEGEWKEVRLDEICQINPRKSNEPDDGLVSFITMDDVSSDALLLRKRTLPYTEVNSGFTSFSDKDVLVAKITPCFENGKGAHVDNLKNGIGFGSTEFHVLRAKRDISSIYVYFLTTTYEFRLRGEINMQGSAGQKRVTTDYLRIFKVKIPATLMEQEQVVSVFAALDKSLEILKEKLTHLKQEKKALMQQLLTGKRRVKVDAL